MIHFRPTPIFENHVEGCHGNHAFSHTRSQYMYQMLLRTTLFRIQGVQINNLAPMRLELSLGSQGKLNWMPG